MIRQLICCLSQDFFEILKLKKVCFYTFYCLFRLKYCNRLSLLNDAFKCMYVFFDRYWEQILKSAHGRRQGGGSRFHCPPKKINRKKINKSIKIFFKISYYNCSGIIPFKSREKEIKGYLGSTETQLSDTVSQVVRALCTAQVQWT